ncbi:hypothetical protein BC829DRAFT_445620 [Chytridium lagenaria]|nr:hypothetical protein BC829DRAFT_445620 [Chytridium lagenaria]
MDFFKRITETIKQGLKLFSSQKPKEAAIKPTTFATTKLLHSAAIRCSGIDLKCLSYLDSYIVEIQPALLDCYTLEASKFGQKLRFHDLTLIRHLRIFLLDALEKVANLQELGTNLITHDNDDEMAEFFITLSKEAVRLSDRLKSCAHIFTQLMKKRRLKPLILKHIVPCSRSLFFLIIESRNYLQLLARQHPGRFSVLLEQAFTDVKHTADVIYDMEQIKHLPKWRVFAYQERLFPCFRKIKNVMRLDGEVMEDELLLSLSQPIPNLSKPRHEPLQHLLHLPKANKITTTIRNVNVAFIEKEYQGSDFLNWTRAEIGLLMDSMLVWELDCYSESHLLIEPIPLVHEKQVRILSRDMMDLRITRDRWMRVRMPDGENLMTMMAFMKEVKSKAATMGRQLKVHGTNGTNERFPLSLQQRHERREWLDKPPIIGRPFNVTTAPPPQNTTFPDVDASICAGPDCNLCGTIEENVLTTSSAPTIPTPLTPFTDVDASICAGPDCKLCGTILDDPLTTSSKPTIPTPPTPLTDDASTCAGPDCKMCGTTADELADENATDDSVRSDEFMNKYVLGAPKRRENTASKSDSGAHLDDDANDLCV